MEDEDFERLEMIQFTIKDGYEILPEDLEWLINQLKIHDTMINLMAPRLTSPVNDADWVKKYFKEEAEKRLCLK